MRSLWLGSIAFATGLLVASAIGFDRYWTAAAQGHHDIMARGGILFLYMLPMVIVVALLLTWLLFLALVRGIRLEPWERVAMPLSAVGGGLVGAFVIALVPMFVPLRGVWLAPAVAVAAVGGGITLMVRGARRLRTAQATTAAV